MIVALTFAFVVGEIMVRLLYKDVTVLYPRYHTDYQYGRYTIRGIRPNADFWHSSIDGSWEFITNSKGFRNTNEFAYQKPVNTFRVLSLGDSHTQGHEVRQGSTFSAILERFLNQHKSNAEVINTGVSGFGNEEELVLLENEGFKYHPDVVVLAFYANDYEDNVKSGLFDLDSQNQLIEKKYEHIPGVRIQNFIYRIPFVQWLSENSYFYSLLFNNTWSYFKYKFAEQAVEQESVVDKSTTVVSNTFEFAVPTSVRFSEYQTELAAALIERMQRFCIKNGIRFIVADIPMMPSRYHFTSSLSSALRTKLDNAHIEYIASETLLQKYSGAAEMHVPHGYNHISEFTHTLIGMEIGQRLLVTVNGTKKK